MIIKNVFIIFAFVTVIINMTEGRLKEYEAKTKYSETHMGKKLMEDFLAKDEEKGVPDGKYAQKLGMVLERKRRGNWGKQISKMAYSYNVF